MSGTMPQLHSCAARRKVSLERIGQQDSKSLQVMLGLERGLHAF